LKAVRKVFPQAIIQRCVVHIKRQIRNYLSTQPKTIQAQELLRISQKITSINTIEQSAYWLVEFKIWYDKNMLFINEQSYKEETKRY